MTTATSQIENLPALPGIVKSNMAPKKKYPYSLVEVYWTDAQTSHGWEDEEESDIDTPTVVTIGFLIKESDKGIRLASTVGEDRTHNSRIDIPAKMITSIKTLK